jgi:hypothetical protein
MDSFTDENQSVFMETDKTGSIQFCRFTENRSDEFQILKKLRKF